MKSNQQEILGFSLKPHRSNHTFQHTSTYSVISITCKSKTLKENVLNRLWRDFLVPYLDDEAINSMILKHILNDSCPGPSVLEKLGKTLPFIDLIERIHFQTTFFTFLLFNDFS